MMIGGLRVANGTLVIALAGGLLALPSLATEEIVVNGRSTVREPAARDEQFQEEMRNYAESLNERLKDTLDEQLRRLRAQKPELASAEIPTRG